MPHQIDRVVRAMQSAVWAMEEQKLREIEAFLVLRAEGWDDYAGARQAFMPQTGSDMFRDEEGRRVDVDGIRYLTVFGVLTPRANMLTSFSGGTSTSMYMKELQRAADDDNVKTILVHVDSPGGEAGMIAEASELMREVRSKKRIVVMAEGLMASGALWLGTAGSVVYATRGSLVGSQGAYTIHTDVSKMREEAGITDTVVRSGKNKALANKVEPLTDAARAQLQERVDSINRLFVADLAKNRGVTEQFVLDRFGQGDVFRAAEAKERQMIDDVLPVNQVIERERRHNANRTSISIGGGKMNVSTRVKAALLAAAVIETMEASDAECLAYLRGLCKAKGLKLEEQKDEDLIKLVYAEDSAEENAEDKAEETTTGIDAQGREYRTAVLEPVRQFTADGDERVRVAEITAIGRTLGVSSDDILTAHTDGLSVEEARKRFKEQATEANRGVSVVPGDSSIDKVCSGLTGAILERAGLVNEVTQDERANGASLSGLSMMEMARATLAVYGMRSSGDAETDALAFLSLGVPGGGHKVKFVPGLNGGVRKLMVADDVSVNRRGDHPDALSNLMGRMLDIRPPQAETTYPVYSRQLQDLPDFRPKTFLETAAFQELDLISEDDMHQQLKFESNLKATIEAHRYGNKVGLTFEMITDDDIGTFAQQLETLRDAAVYTLDNKCRSLLVSNPVLADGTVLFHSSRGNLISGGGSLGAPSAAIAAEHRRLHRLIKGFGTTRPMNLPPRSALLPVAHEEVALQTFLVAVQDAKVANADSNINTVRGTITPTIDSMLDSFSADAWYTFSDTRQAPIVYAYLRGTGGARGTRTTWFDPDRGTRYVALDVAFGIAPFTARGSVKNNGA